ncbi:MAG: L-serine ammonia-lyase, iron-sulfur-dependent subunit beta [Cellulosilyticaceae bacterium]
MKEISLFDVIGPNMIGPSSSHTAGALRIARMVHKLIERPIKKVTFILYGSFAHTYKGHGTDKALVAGILGMSTEDESIREAFLIASRCSLEYLFVPTESNVEAHPNTVEIIATDDAGDMTIVKGASIGGGNIRIEQINGVNVEFTGEYTTIVIKQQDKPGIVAHITEVLAKFGVNIAFMKLYRESKGSFAYTMIEIDEVIDKLIIKEINKNEHIINVKIIKEI